MFAPETCLRKGALRPRYCYHRGDVVAKSVLFGDFVPRALPT